MFCFNNKRIKQNILIQNTKIKKKLYEYLFKCYSNLFT